LAVFGQVIGGYFLGISRREGEIPKLKPSWGGKYLTLGVTAGRFFFTELLWWGGLAI